jgi:hypothetical protein
MAEPRRVTITESAGAPEGSDNDLVLRRFPMAPAVPSQVRVQLRSAGMRPSGWMVGDSDPAATVSQFLEIDVGPAGPRAPGPFSSCHSVAVDVTVQDLAGAAIATPEPEDSVGPDWSPVFLRTLLASVSQGALGLLVA